METVLDRARQFGLPDLYWWVKLDSPPEVADLLLARGATVDETLDVLAVDLRQGPPELLPPVRDVTLRWATEVATHRDGTQVGVTVFGGSMPPEERLAEEAKRDSATVKAGDGGMVVAYVDDAPVGSGGLAMADGVGPPVGRRGPRSRPRPGRLPRHPRRPPQVRRRPRRDDGPRQGPRRNLGPDPAPGGFAVYGQEISYRVPLPKVETSQPHRIERTCRPHRSEHRSPSAPGVRQLLS